MFHPSNEAARIRDALYYLHPNSGCNTLEARGVVVGVMSTLMALGWDFEVSFKFMKACLPYGYRVECIPESWRKCL